VNERDSAAVWARRILAGAGHSAHLPGALCSACGRHGRLIGAHDAPAWVLTDPDFWDALEYAGSRSCWVCDDCERVWMLGMWQ
jgi:hypothetical protein